MDMRSLINLVEGRSIKLDTGRRVVESPSRNDITQMLIQSKMLRGASIAFKDKPDTFLTYIWPGRSLSHWTAINELLKMRPPGSVSKYFSFKVALEPEIIREDRFWRKQRIYDCQGFYAAFGGFVECDQNTIFSTSYLSNLFKNNPDSQ